MKLWAAGLVISCIGLGVGGCCKDSAEIVNVDIGVARSVLEDLLKERCAKYEIGEKEMSCSLGMVLGYSCRPVCEDGSELRTICANKQKPVGRCNQLYWRDVKMPFDNNAVAEAADGKQIGIGLADPSHHFLEIKADGLRKVIFYIDSKQQAEDLAAAFNALNRNAIAASAGVQGPSANPEIGGIQPNDVVLGENVN